MGYDDTKYSGDTITSTDWNDLITDLKSRNEEPTKEFFRGSQCTGSDGTTGRTITLNNISLTTDEKTDVYVNTNKINQSGNVDYSITHNSTQSVITFNVVIWNTDYIEVKYNA